MVRHNEHEDEKRSTYCLRQLASDSFLDRSETKHGTMCNMHFVLIIFEKLDPKNGKSEGGKSNESIRFLFMLFFADTFSLSRNNALVSY